MSMVEEFTGRIMYVFGKIGSCCIAHTLMPLEVGIAEVKPGILDWIWI